MTWGQFKKAVESEGVDDNAKIFFIDTHLPDEDTLSVGLGDDLGITITS